MGSDSLRLSGKVFHLWSCTLLALGLACFFSLPDSASAAPTITANSPAAGTTGVPVAATINATFSEPMDPATITPGSVTLSQQLRIRAIAAGYNYTLALRDNGTVTGWGYNSNGQIMVPDGLSDVIAIAGAAGHNVALKSDGTVVAWGDNTWGQSTVPTGLAGVTAIAAGGHFTLVLKTDETVVVWGDNSKGQRTVPGGLAGVTGIAAGTEHALALKSDGTVVAWGDNSYGQVTVPPGLSDVIAVAAGLNYSLALKADGTVVAWGDNRKGQCSVPTGLSGVVAISAQMDNAMALTNDGTVVAWGDNSYGQTNVPAGLTGITAIAAGCIHSVALKNDGTVTSWGDNSHSQNTLPPGLAGVTGVAAGSGHTVALKSDGTLFAWGLNLNGQADIPAGLSGASAVAAGFAHTLSLGSSGVVTAWGMNYDGQTDVPADLAGVTAIAAGDYHSVARRDDGTVVAWGRNSSGQATVPGGLAGVTKVAAGTAHTLALKQDGTVTAWGSNSFNAVTPPLGLSGVTAVAAGGYHSLALKSDGTVTAWGENSWGQSTVPTGLADVIAIAAGKSHSVALKSDGTVVAWGDNNNGQISVPAGLDRVVAIAAGNSFTVAVKNDGTLVGWGDNKIGQVSIPQDPYLQPLATAVSYDTASDSVTITPTALLPLATTLTATVNRGVRSLEGTHPAADYSWSFATIDPVPPVTIPLPASGTYSSPQYVTLTANEPATIYYTTNGTTPSISSPVYSGPIKITVTTTLQFFARDSAGNSEAPQVATYTMVADATPPVTTASPAGGTYSAAQNVTLTANEPATIYYTTNGAVPSISSRVYSGPIPIPATTVLKFFARDSAGNSEGVKTAAYTINLDTIPPVTTVSPAGGTYSAPQNVILTANEPATIYYTTSGATPTTSSRVYSGPIPIAATTTLKFFARDTAGNSEGVKTAAYTINLDTTPPVTIATPGGGTYSSPQIVILSANEPATIYYTTNGAAPTTSSHVYSGPISIPVTTALKFFARDIAGNSETVKTQNYTIKLDQSISFAALPVKTYGDPSFILNATASSGLAISYTSSNTAVAIVSGSTVTIVGAGSALITANQGGNAVYNPAPAVARTLTVNKAMLTVRAVNATRVYGTANPAFSVTYSGFVNGDTATVLSGSPVLATVAAPASPVGTYPITVTAGTLSAANYSFSFANGTLTVTKADQVITFAALPTKTYGAPIFELGATSSSGLAITYASSNPAVATVSGSSINIVGAGSAVITASQGGDAVYNPAPAIARTLTVDKATLTVQAANATRVYGADNPAFSAIYSGFVNGDTVAVLTGAPVLACAATITSPVGNYPITASAGTLAAANYSFSLAGGTLTVTKANQTVAFGPLAVKTYGDPAFSLGATASSGLTVSYTSSNPAVATVSGSTVTIVGAGSTVITASQAGNANYNAAPAVSQALTVNKAVATIAFGQLTFTYDGTPKPVAVTTVPAGLAVSVTYDGSAVPPTDVGNYTVVATVNDANYQGSATATEEIAKKSQTITFAPLPVKTYGDAPFTFTADASSNLNITFQYDTSIATITKQGQKYLLTIVGAGTTVITATQPGNRNYSEAPPVSQTLVVNKAAATVTLGSLSASYDGSAKAATATTSPAGLVVKFSYNGATTLPVAAGIYSVIGTIDNANYQGSATGTLTIAKAGQSITFAPLATKSYGNAPFNPNASASSNLAISYTSSNPAVATISGTTVTIVGVGTTIITASQGGDGNYNAAPAVQQTLTVAKGTATVTLGSLSATYNGTPRAATATTVPAGLAVTITYNDSATSPTAVGSYTVLATIDSPYYQGSATGMLTIAKGAQTIAFAALPAKTVGNTPFTLSATATSGLAVSYTSSDPAVATVSGTTVTIVGAGTTTITASQVGDANYNAANPVAQTLTVNAAQATTGKTAVTIGSTTSYYDTVTAALAAISAGSTTTIKLQAMTFAEAVNFNVSGALVSIVGGFDSGFTSAAGMTTIQGNLVISSGALVADRLVIM